MPYRKGFRIELENLDELIDTDVFANILYQQTDAPDSSQGWFHAHFHTARHDGPEPIEIFDAKGKGHYVGCSLSTQGREQNYLSFLEAPEYVWIDEDWQAPRITGTGLEDYFLGGWYFREGPFTGPLHGVPSKDAFNASVSMYRIHELDAISFNERIKFQFVNPWDPQRLQPYAYSSVAFCYIDSAEGCGPTLPATRSCFAGTGSKTPTM